MKARGLAWVGVGTGDYERTISAAIQGILYIVPPCNGGPV